MFTGRHIFICLNTDGQVRKCFFFSLQVDYISLVKDQNVTNETMQNSAELSNAQTVSCKDKNNPQWTFYYTAHVLAACSCQTAISCRLALPKLCLHAKTARRQEVTPRQLVSWGNMLLPKLAGRISCSADLPCHMSTTLAGSLAHTIKLACSTTMKCWCAAANCWFIVRSRCLSGS